MPNVVDLKIGQQIRTLRRSKDVSQETMASRLGVPFKQFQRFERGTSRVSISQLVEIAAMLDTPMSVFFDQIDRTEPGNDNLTPLQIVTKQGLALLKAFHSIEDVQLRRKVLQTVETMAAAGALSPKET